MLNEKEIMLLKIIGENMLIRKEEIEKKLNGGSDDYAMIMEKLISEGYVNNLETVGSQCFAITQKGIRTLRLIVMI